MPVPHVQAHAHRLECPPPPHTHTHRPLTLSAFSHWHPLSHALMAALVMVVSGLTPITSNVSNTSRAFCQLPSRVSVLRSLVRPVPCV